LQRDPNDPWGHRRTSPGYKPGQTAPRYLPPPPQPETVSGGSAVWESTGRFLARKFSGGAAALLAVLQSLVLLIGLTSYTAVYFAYDYVYAKVEVNPSELGLNYLSLLGRSPGAVICITFIILPIVLIFFDSWFRPLIVLGVVGALATYFLASFYAQDDQRVEDERAAAAANWVISVRQNAAAEVKQFSRDVSETRQSLVDGDEVQPSGVFGVTVLNITAVPSKLIWLDDPVNSSLMQERVMLGPGCVTYLGESDGLSVIYSPLKEVIARVPVNKVLVVRTRFESVERCSESLR